MKHWLQTLWWEWKWRRLRSARGLIARTLPLENDHTERMLMIHDLRRVERDMADLEARISGRAK